MKKITLIMVMALLCCVLAVTASCGSGSGIQNPADEIEDEKDKNDAESGGAESENAAVPEEAPEITDNIPELESYGFLFFLMK
jgi:hypothetical protein